MKKIALIGNMNNNFFSMMRYFRDAGFNADLFMFKDESEHFLPENDSWEIEKWKPYIYQLEVNNNERALFGSGLKYFLNQIKNYDYYIGCGITPAIFRKIGMKLDMFIPYAYGIEFFGCHKFSVLHPFDEIIFQIAKHYQKRGIKDCGFSVTPDYNWKNRNVFDKLRVNPLKISIPMLYTKKETLVAIPINIQEYINILTKSDLRVFSHVSHKWKRIPKDWVLDFKRNQVLIKGFAKYINDIDRSATNPLLILIEYGYDVPESKKLIDELGIKNYVLWLPILSRKEIMILLGYIDLGGGEFGGALWGGTGWEFISKGVPFFQYVKMTKEEYLNSTGDPMPEFINVDSPEKIKGHLLSFEKSPGIYKVIGKELSGWFEQHNGKNLAAKYLEIIEKNRKFLQ